MPRRRRASIAREMQSIRKSLATITQALVRLAPLLEASLDRRSTPAAARRKPKLTRARRVALQEQGRYMGYVRALKPAQKARVKALREKRGIGPAIDLAKRLSRARR